MGNLKQTEIDDAKRQQHESLQRLREAQNELDKNEGDIIKYNKIGELWEVKCERLEEELMNTKNAVKQVRGLNDDSFEVTEELKEEIMFLQMSIRKFEQRAEFAEGIVDKLEHQCEGLHDQLILEESEVPCETEEGTEIVEKEEQEEQQQQQQFQSDIEQVEHVEYNNHLGLVDGDTSEAVE